VRLVKKHKKMAGLCKPCRLFYGSFRFCVLAFRPHYPALPSALPFAAEMDKPV